MIKVIERPTIKLKEINFDLIKEGNKKTKIEEFSKDIGRYPYVEIGDLSVQNDQMILLQLFNDQFLPRISIQFRDTSGQLIDPLFPIDDTILKVFIQSNSDTLMPVRMDFKITDINPIKSKSGDNYDIIFSLSGILDVSFLYGTFYTSYKDTSYNVLKTLSSEAGLGFASNIDNTDDDMIWINPADQYLEFIQNVVKFSYKSQESFMFAYVDFYYNLNYVDIETALSEDIEDQKGMAGNDYYFDTQNQEEKTEDLILTNHPDRISSNLYIDKYNLLNRSTAINIEIGYLYYLSYYDTDGNTLYKLILDNISTPGKDNNSIIMKGGIGEVTELQKYAAGEDYTGKVDTDNVHKYFLYSLKHNENNLKFLQKVKLKITLNKANFNLYRFQKVKVNFYKTSQLDENDVTIQKTEPVTQKDVDEKAGVIADEEKLNQRLSGEWLITSISYTFGKRGGMEQEVTLVKRELQFNDNDFDPNKTY
jgi:hypothetical protein